MPKLTLKDIAEITNGKLTGNGDQLIETLQTDSRKVFSNADSLFFAINGARHDGHSYIQELARKGTLNVVIDRKDFPVARFPEVNFIAVTNTIVALQQLAAWYRRSLKMPVVAVTGSNGKTVVKEWLFQSLSVSTIVSRSPRSYNSQIGVPLSVWELNPEADWAIIEAGISQPGEMEKLQKIIFPDYGIFTNIGQAHQENFQNLEQKTREKLKLFSAVKTMQYCMDHNIIQSIVSSDQDLKHVKKITWSRHNKAAYLFVKNEIRSSSNTNFQLSVGGKDEELTLPFSDDASVENCLHIACFLYYHNFDTKYIQQTFNQLTQVAMRLEQIKGNGDSTLINDSYNSDLNSLKIALDHLAEQKQHSRHMLILSDLRQTGLSPEELYSQVTGMVLSYHLDGLVAIGPEISRYEGLPPFAKRYNSTEEFMNVLPGENFADSAVLIKGAREFGFERIVRALSRKKHTTVLRINMDHLVSNLNYFRSLLKPGTKIMVMVKALSYGSGSYEIASRLQHEKVDYLGVAFADEGVELRKKGISLPVLVMSPTPDTYEEIIEYSLEPEIYNLNTLMNFSKAVRSAQLSDFPVHLKLDTGMHRLGFMTEELPTLLEALKTCNNIRIKAIFSHLAVSGNSAEDTFTRLQFDRFDEIYSQLEKFLGYKPMRHILNSAGIERFPEADYEMVRLGIGLHGISGVGKNLKAVSTLITHISQIKKIPLTETVGYNRHGKLKRDSVIAIIPIGYADGLDRKLGNGNGQVIVNGKMAPYVGDICMDMSMIDITDCKAEEGDEVIIFGEKNPVEILAHQVGTIPYEILTNVSERVKRIYINE